MRRTRKRRPEAVDGRGRITIPRAIRDVCAVQTGSRVFFVQTGTAAFECYVLPAGRSVLGTIAEHAGEGPAPSIEELRAGMAGDIAAELGLDTAEL